MFKLFDREEKYVKNLKNVTKAKHIKEINGENALEIEIVDDVLIEKKYRIAYKNKLGIWHEFIVNEIIEKDNTEGLTRILYCESSFYETITDYIEDLRAIDTTANIALEKALSSTRWEVGTVHNLGNNTETFYHIDSKSAVQKVAETWKGELQTRVEVVGNKITNRYVDLLTRLGADRGKRFVYGKNLEEIKRTVKNDDVITAVFGYGKGEEIGDGYGRRIDFSEIEWSTDNGDPADKPLGQAYIGDDEAKQVWGRNSDNGKVHTFSKVEFDDVTDKAELLKLTYDKLQEVNEPYITYEGKVIVFGLDVGLGDTVGIKDKSFNPALEIKARVIRIVEDLLVEEESEIVLGNYIEDIASTTLEQQAFINNFRQKAGVWDRSSQFNKDGTLNANFVLNLLQEFNDKANATGGYVFHREGEGILTIDTPDESTATMAVQVKGGLIRIANSKNPDGTWKWTTAMDGKGIIASTIVTGILKGGKVNFDLENGTLLIGEDINNYSLYFDGTNINLNITGTAKFSSKQLIFEFLDDEGDIVTQITGENKGFDKLFVGEFDSPNTVLKELNSRTVYVDPNGSDTNGDGSYSNPYQTWGTALDSLKIYLAKPITVKSKSSGVTYNEELVIQNFMGDVLTIQLNGSTVKDISLKNVDNFIMVKTGRVNSVSSPITAINCTNVEISDVNGYGNNQGANGFYAERSNVRLLNCDFYDVDTCIASSRNSVVYISNNKGLGNVRGIYAYYGGIIKGYGTAPSGPDSSNHAVASNGGHILDTFTPDSGAATPLPAPATTTSWNTNGSKSWRENYGGQWYSNSDVLQGKYGTWGRYKGLWFFPSLTGTLSGKTITSAKLTVTRANNSGYSSAVPLYVYGHGYSSQPSGEPTMGTYIGQLASLKWGETKTINLPSSIFSALVNGSIKGFGIYTSDTSDSKYARMSGSAKLTITYE